MRIYPTILRRQFSAALIFMLAPHLVNAQHRLDMDAVLNGGHHLVAEADGCGPLIIPSATARAVPE